LLGCLVVQMAKGEDPNFKAGHDQVAAAIEKIPASKVKLTLYSLDPHDARIFTRELPESSDKVFHGYPILGKAEIIPEQEKQRLLGGLAKGVREGNFGAWCFDPRHGLRVVNASATNDFVICYECLQVRAYGFSGGNSFSTSASPEAIFDGFLKKYKLEKAK
jgi:hypothetical protein